MSEKAVKTDAKKVEAAASAVYGGRESRHSGRPENRFTKKFKRELQDKLIIGLTVALAVGVVRIATAAVVSKIYD